jgi:hypothetical protein
MSLVLTPKTQSRTADTDLVASRAVVETAEGLFPSYLRIFISFAGANSSVLQAQPPAPCATLQNEFSAAGQIWQLCNAVNNFQ